MSQIICPISGEILYKSDLFLGFNLSDVHPIFRAKKELILSTDMIFRFQAAKNLREKKMYFLAVLNTTDLVDFTYPANPAPYVVEACFLDAITLAPWIDFARAKMNPRRERISFPRYKIDKSTSEMKNISIWISALYDIRNLFLEENRQEELKKDLTNKAADIEREFKTASAFGRAFTLPLARWALEMAEVESGVFEKWRTILCTPLEDAWTLQKEDVEEILDCLRANLPINNDQVIAVISQCKLLLAKSQESFVSFAFVEDEVPANIKSSGPKGFTIDSPLDSEPLLKLEDIGPEPKRSQFIKTFEYLQAKARWDLLKKQVDGGLGGEYGQF